MKNKTPLLSIVMITYNHAPYIKEAMESCLSQETSFPFELIVCDDASTDGTTEIVSQYAEKHDNLFFLPQPVNGRGAHNLMDGLRQVRSKYIAFCEGDDYWISPHKLERQVRFLEENPDFSVSCHKVELKFENRPGDEKKQYIYKDCSADDERIRQGIFYADEAVANYYFQTSSYVFRWRFRDGLPHWFRKWMLYDHALFMLHAAEGKIKYFDEAMSVWRRNETGYSWLQNVDKGVFFQKEGYGWISFYQEMDKFFSGRFHLQIRERILLALRNMVENCLETGNLARIKKIAEDHQEWFLKLVKDNASLFEAVKLALPEKITHTPPWTGKPEEKTEEPQKVIGGVMELDLLSIPENADSIWSHWTKGKEYVCFANAFSALIAWVYHRRVRRIWLPVVVSPILVEELDRLWIPYCFYPVGKDLTPPIDFIASTKPGDAVLTQAYFGRPPEKKLCEALSERKDVLWIDDRSASLEPANNTGADVVLYNPVAVLGVPDGGVLVGEGLTGLQPSPADKSGFITMRRELTLECFENLSNRANLVMQKQKIEIENPLPGGNMSRLTLGLLQRIPLTDIAKRCRINWSLLHESLSQWSLYPKKHAIDSTSTVYPLLIPENIPTVFFQTALKKKSILCGGLGMNLNEKYKGTLGEESELLKRLIYLPCDHRYDADDMLTIANEILLIFCGKSHLGAPGTRITI